MNFGAIFCVCMGTIKLNKLPIIFGALSVSQFSGTVLPTALDVCTQIVTAYMAFAQFNESLMTVFATQIQPQLMSRQR